MRGDEKGDRIGEIQIKKMIIKISCQVIIRGEKFTPIILSLPQKISFVEKYENGDVINSGRYEGTLSTEGMLSFSGEIDEVLQFIKLNILTHFTRELVEFNLCILVNYEGECNFELTHQQLNEITSLKIPLAITCYSG